MKGCPRSLCCAQVFVCFFVCLFVRFGSVRFGSVWFGLVWLVCLFDCLFDPLFVCLFVCLFD